MDECKGPPTLVPSADCLAIAQRNQLHSPLLRLPAEIRNNIFNLALELSARSWQHNSHLHWDRLQLSRASRQIFAETAHAYFAVHIYPVTCVTHYPSDGWGIKNPKNEFTPSQMRALLHINVEWCTFQWEHPSTGTREPIRRRMRTLRIFPALKRLTVSEAPYQVTDHWEWHTKEFRDQLRNQDLEVEYEAPY